MGDFDGGGYADLAVGADAVKTSDTFTKTSCRGGEPHLRLTPDHGPPEPGSRSSAGVSSAARRQGARALELRAAKALFDRRMARGDHEGAAEAARLVAAIAEGFPEGRDAPEVREAASIVART